MFVILVAVIAVLSLVAPGQQSQNNTAHGPPLYRTMTLHTLWVHVGPSPLGRIIPTEKPSGDGGPRYTRILNTSE